MTSVSILIPHTAPALWLIIIPAAAIAKADTVPVFLRYDGNKQDSDQRWFTVLSLADNRWVSVNKTHSMLIIQGEIYRGTHWTGHNLRQCDGIRRLLWGLPSGRSDVRRWRTFPRPSRMRRRPSHLEKTLHRSELAPADGYVLYDSGGCRCGRWCCVNCCPYTKIPCVMRYVDFDLNFINKGAQGICYGRLGRTETQLDV